MADEVNVLHELTTGFERGDPKVIEGWAKDYPAGFKRLILPAFSKLKQIDEPHYQAVASEVIGQIFAEHGVYGALTALGEAITADKKDDAIAKFNAIAKFLTDAKALAANAKTGRTDRDVEQDERELSQNERDKKAFYGSVRTEVNTYVMSEMNRLIRLGLPKGKKVTVDTANRLRKEINAELNTTVNTQQGYAERYNAVMGAKNKDRSVKFINAEARKFLPRVVTKLLKEFNLTGPAGAAANGNGQRRVAARSDAGGGNRVVTGVPKTSEVDFRRTDKSQFLSAKSNGRHGSAWLLSGKQAKW